MKNFNSLLETLLEKSCALLMFIMVMDVSWQVLSRFVLQNPSSFSEELARFLLIWIGFLGGAYAFRKYAHLGLDIISQKLSGKKRQFLDGFGNVVCILFATVILLYGGTKIVLITLELNQLSAALQIKMAYVYLVIPLCGLLIVSFALERVVFGTELCKQS